MENTYLIVGGNSTIGKHIIEKLSAAGSQCIVLSRNEFRSSYATVTSRTIDITREEIPSEWIPESLDGLVYLPGTINLKPFRAISQDTFREDMEINFHGAVRTIQAAYKSLKRSGKASIVLFSTVAVRTGMPFHASIASAKGAVEGLARSLASEFAPEIRVNCIAPSLTATRLSERLLSSEEKIDASRKRHPMQDIGDPADIATLAVYLLGNDTRWMTGQVIGMDGGIGVLKS